MAAGGALERTESTHPNAFDRWGELTAALDDRHALPGLSLRLGGSFGGEPEFAPDAGSVTGVEESDGRAVVQTTREVSFGARFREYELRQAGDEWRIEHIGEYFDDPASPFCPAPRLDQLTATVSTTAPLRPLAPIDRRLAFSRWFLERDVVDADGDASRIRGAARRRLHQRLRGVHGRRFRV